MEKQIAYEKAPTLHINEQSWSMLKELEEIRIGKREHIDVYS